VTPPIVKVNGNESGSASTPGSTERERNREKADKHKPKRKERKERDHAERDATREAGSEGGNDEKKDDATTATGPPKPNLDTTGSPAPGSEGSPLSPRTESTGVRTPTSRKQARNPWTLFIRLPNTTTETELRDFFGEAKNGITRVNFPPPLGGRDRKIAYVEFGDEEAMKAGLDKHAEKLGDGVPEVKRADNEQRSHGGFRGGRGGRGGFRGGFASRSFATAGLVRGGAPKTNGDA